jgi:hypothetical protein
VQDLITYGGFFLVFIIEWAVNSINFSYTYVPLIYLIWNTIFIGINYASLALDGNTPYGLITYKDGITAAYIFTLEAAAIVIFYITAALSNFIKFKISQS